MASEEKKTALKNADKPATKKAGSGKAITNGTEVSQAEPKAKKQAKPKKPELKRNAGMPVSRRRQRMSFSRIKDIEEVPNLLDIQKQSYEWFISKGLSETYREISPVEAFTHNLVLEFMEHRFEDPTYSVEECKRRDVTYSARLHIKVKLTYRNTGEIREQEVFVGDFPMMTDRGTFIINGTERVIVTQLVRSPGVYFSQENKEGINIFNASIIPNRGAWLELDASPLRGIGVKLDRNHKFPVTVLLRALGLSTDEEILELFNGDEQVANTLKRDPSRNQQEALVEIYKTMRPDDFTSMQGAKELSKKSIDPEVKARYVGDIAPFGGNLLDQLYFQEKKYDLAEVGRYKVNKKLNIWERLIDRTITRDLRAEGSIDEATGEILDGEVLVPAGTLIDRRKAHELKRDPKAQHIFEAWVQSPDGSGKELRVQGNGNIPEGTKIVTKEDIITAINYLVNLTYGVGGIDDIDHLGNRRLKTVGELLQNQFRIGLSRMERLIRERMTLQDVEVVMPQTLINFRPVVAALKEFFGSSQLSQFMDQTNPLAELTHKRRLSALGPGGLNREHAGFEVRDVHHSHYGRICPIETPEGPNIGLMGALCNYSKINPYGFIQTPYMRVQDGKVTGEIEYLTADEEDIYVIAQANEELTSDGRFARNRVEARYKDKIIVSDVAQVDYIDVSPKQIVSIATALIPFLEHDDAGRALMGANMQRQAVPLIKAEAPLVGTGMEYRAAVDSGIVVTANKSGTVVEVDANHITMAYDDNTAETYPLLKFKRSNQGTCINQKPVVSMGDLVQAGEVLADGPATDMGEMALGRNVLIAFLPWEGYNYEDAILLNEKLVKEDVFTSIHIEEYECEARLTKLGPEEITRDIPNQGEEALKDLDEEGIIRVGAEVRAGDILVGKVTPKGETELTPEEKLLRAIFGEKAREVRDTSLKVPHGESGKVVAVDVFSRENNDELGHGVLKLVRVYVAQKRKISEGDKMAGRHGNKGVIARILPEEEMPFLPDGTPIEVVLNPLGVPSRMNIGQVLETHLGRAAVPNPLKHPNRPKTHMATPVFDGAHEDQIIKMLEEAGWNSNGKTELRDGRTGEPFANPVTVGYAYFLKLLHLVDDKIHARATGPYSLVTQQPLGGKAQFGGQRFGEMEVWALEAYGAANTLQELLTVKSDDIVGRVNTYAAIVKGENVPGPGIPEAFKVLIKELQSLSLDVRIMTGEDKEISIKDLEEDASDSARDLGFDLGARPYRIGGDFHVEERRPEKESKRGEEDKEDDLLPISDFRVGAEDDIGIESDRQEGEEAGMSDLGDLEIPADSKDDEADE